MAREEFIKILQCPYCGGGLELERRDPATGPEVEFGVLRCQCYRYGIVLGVTVIRQLSPPHSNEDPIVAHLDKLEYEQAIHQLLARELSPATAEHRNALMRIIRRMSGRKLLPGSIIQPSENLRAALARLRPTYYGEYLYYRHANPSLLAALPILAAIAHEVETGKYCSLSQSSEAAENLLWSIDLGCGIGHTVHSLKALLPQAKMVAADLDFLNLLLAKNYLVSDANFICFDAEAGLPFRDGIFHTMFSLDCVHYIRGKLRLGRELRRVGRPNALYALAHLHNTQRSNPNAGIPLTADGYSKVFQPLGGRLYAEATLLDGFCRTGMLALELAGSDARLQVSDAFTYLSLGKVAEDLSSWRLDRFIAARSGQLTLNPIYSPATAGGSLKLLLQWPSQMLRDECSAGFQPLAENVEIAPKFMKEVIAGRYCNLPADTLEALIRSFVIVLNPSGEYLRAPGAA